MNRLMELKSFLLRSFKMIGDIDYKYCGWKSVSFMKVNEGYE